MVYKLVRMAWLDIWIIRTILPILWTNISKEIKIATNGSDPAQSLRDKLGVKSPQAVENLKILFYGISGGGKTTLCGTADDNAATSPVLILDVEGGTTVLHDKPGVDVRQIRTIKEIQEIADELHKHPKYYKTIEIDGVTELQQMDMREVMKEQFNKKPETTDIYVPSPREWGKSGARVKEIMRYLRDLPCHVVVTAMQREEKDDRTGIVKFVPDVPGQLKSQLPGFFDIVGYLRVTEKQGTTIRTMQFKGTERVMAKDRTKTLPDTLDDPTLPAMWDYILKGEAEIDRTIDVALLQQAVSEPTPVKEK